MKDYQRALSISPLPMVLVNRTGEIVMTNDHFDRLFEYPTGELVGQRVECLVPEASRSHHPQLREAYDRFPVKRSMGAGRDLSGVTKTGAIVPLELGLQQVFDGDEPLSLVLAVDIRERKREETKLHVVLNAAASAMIMVDKHGKFVFCNEATLNLLGYERSELMELDLGALVPEDVRAAHGVYVNGYNSAPTERQMGKGRALFIRHKSGAHIPVQIALTPVETADGHYVMSTIIDLSESIEASRSLEAKNAQLEEANEQLKQFAYSAGHDLRAPLTSLSSLLSICLQDIEEDQTEDLSENLKRALDICEINIDKVARTLDVARSNAVPAEMQETDLDALVRKSWNGITTGQSDNLLQVEFSKGSTVKADQTSLEIILDNLLSNALRYVAEPDDGGWIKVHFSKSDDRATIAVEDNGAGISEEHQSKLFEMFSRLDQKSGHGLGLNLVRKHAVRMGGTVSVKSKLGSGTIFTVQLPQV